MASKDQKPCVEVNANELKTLKALLNAKAGYSLTNSNKFVLSFENQEQVNKTMAALKNAGIDCIASPFDEEDWFRNS